MKRQHLQRVQNLVALAHLRLQAVQSQALLAQCEHQSRVHDTVRAEQHALDCEGGLAHVLEAADGVPLEAWQRWRTATQQARVVHARALAAQAETSTVCAQLAAQVCVADTVHAHLRGAAQRAERRYHDHLDTRAGEAAAFNPATEVP